MSFPTNDYLKVCCNKNENRSDEIKIKVDTENGKSEESQVWRFIQHIDFNKNGNIQKTKWFIEQMFSFYIKKTHGEYTIN